MLSVNSEILVLGASGFVGRHLHRHFRSRFSQHRATFLSSTDIDLKDRLLLDAEAKHYDSVVVVFLAGRSPYHGTGRDIFDENVVMLRNTVEAFGAKLAHIIYASTADVYGKVTLLPIAEQTRLDPQSWYAKSKLEAEELLGRLPSSIKVTVFRMASLYGEFDDGKRAIVGRLKNVLLNGKAIRLVGSGRQMRNLTYADDVARVFAVALSSRVGGTYNLVSGHHYGIDQIVDILARAANVTPTKIYGIEGEERDVIFDNRRLLNAFPDSRFSRLEDVATLLISSSEKAGFER